MIATGYNARPVTTPAPALDALVCTLDTPMTNRERCIASLRAARGLAECAITDSARRHWETVECEWLNRLAKVTDVA